MNILYLATTGAGDATKASIPLHIAANGSVEAEQECAVVLAGDAVELVSRETADRVDGDELDGLVEALERLRARPGERVARAAVEALPADENLAAGCERADPRSH